MKITLNPVTSFTNDTSAVATVNNNYNTISTGFDNTLSRDGTSPNTMAAAIDMNSNRIINLPAPSNLSEPLRLQDAQTLNGHGTITIGNVPNGGTTGQVLNKTSNVDQATGWATIHQFPNGGGAGQYLTKVDGTDYNTTWTTLPTSGIPSTMQVLGTLTSLSSTTVAGSVNTIYLQGYATAGDCAPFTYKRTSTPTLTTFGYKQSLDGAWWVYVPTAGGIDAEAFGAVGDWNGVDGSATDNTTFIQNAINFAAQEHGQGVDRGGGVGNDVVFQAKSYMITSQITVYDGVRIMGKSPFTTQLVMSTSFSTTSNMIQLGTPGLANAICLSQSRASAGNLILNGSAVTGGQAILIEGRYPTSIYSSGNDTGITFTVHGTNYANAIIAETVSGTNAGIATTNAGFKTVTSVSCSGATAGNITVGNKTYASFSCRIEDMQLFSQNVNAVANTAMVWTSNAQHWGGLKNVKIFGGNRVCAWFEQGIGGASYFTFEDVETFNLGNNNGLSVQNPQIFLNYGGLISPLRNVVCGGPGIATAGADSTGIWINGGFCALENVHTEAMDIGIKCRWASTNTGSLSIKNSLGYTGMSVFIQAQVGVVPAGTILVENCYSNGSTTTLLQTTGAGVTGNIIAPTVY